VVIRHDRQGALMIRVLLVDDHGIVRAGIRKVLEGHVEFSCVGEAEDGDAALALVRKLTPDVVLCDLHMPGPSGLELTERLLRLPSAPKVIALSMQSDGPLPRRVLEAGAHGYLSKTCTSEELLRAIREVARGKRYIGADIAQHLALGSVSRQTTSPFDGLSPRELEITLMLVQGIRTGEMALRLSLSPKTISTHKYRLLQKLGIRDVMSLARLAGQHGLLDPTQMIPDPDAAGAVS